MGGLIKEFKNFKQTGTPTNRFPTPDIPITMKSRG
jgi:hypothetical protein